MDEFETTALRNAESKFFRMQNGGELARGVDVILCERGQCKGHLSPNPLWLPEARLNSEAPKTTFADTKRGQRKGGRSFF
jgi:hypothetical protein